MNFKKFRIWFLSHSVMCLLYNIRLLQDYEVWTGASVGRTDTAAALGRWILKYRWDRRDGGTLMNYVPKEWQIISSFAQYELAKKRGVSKVIKQNSTRQWWDLFFHTEQKLVRIIKGRNGRKEGRKDGTKQQCIYSEMSNSSLSEMSNEKLRH